MSFVKADSARSAAGWRLRRDWNLDARLAAAIPDRSCRDDADQRDRHEETCWISALPAVPGVPGFDQRDLWRPAGASADGKLAALSTPLARVPATTKASARLKPCASTIPPIWRRDQSRQDLQYLRSNMDPQDGRVVSNFIVRALEGAPLEVYGGGSRHDPSAMSTT